MKCQWLVHPHLDMLSSYVGMELTGDRTLAKPVVDYQFFLVWSQFNHVVALNTIWQRNDEQQLRDVLMLLRITQFLQNRLNGCRIFSGETLKTNMEVNCEKGLFVFPTHAEEWQHNKVKF